MEDKSSAQQYQNYTDGQLHKLLDQAEELGTAKEIAKEALRWLKMKQIMKHQPQMYQTRKE